MFVVKANIVVPEMAAHRKNTPLTNGQRTRGNTTAAPISRAEAKIVMHTDREISEAYRAGALPA